MLPNKRLHIMSVVETLIVCSRNPYCDPIFASIDEIELLARCNGYWSLKLTRHYHFEINCACISK